METSYLECPSPEGHGPVRGLFARPKKRAGKEGLPSLRPAPGTTRPGGPR